MSVEKKHKRYQGDKLDVLWHGGLCIHIGECGRAEGDLFVGGRDPWCNPNLVDPNQVVDIVERCPTGALTYVDPTGTTQEEAQAENTVHVANNGPLYVRGALDIDGATEEMEGTKFRAALCRCGQSKNKPFCDNAHEKVGFVDRGAVGVRGESLESTGGPLKVTRAPNGPLLVSGAFTLYNGSGQVAWEGTKAALCRCGASKNKPFCDGAHKAAGFEAE